MHHVDHQQMKHSTIDQFPSDFCKDVYTGLSQEEKWLSSKYFYDEKGDEIFQSIMQMGTYYLTRSEFDIFDQKSDAILDAIGTQSPFRILELGAGDGRKTKVLLKHFLDRQASFTYAPCDISASVLNQLSTNLSVELPGLSLETLEGDYFKVLADVLQRQDGCRNVVFFLGSNIGNFTSTRSKEFLTNIRSHLHPGDKLMMGIDLKKDPMKILAAYDDAEGITASFNLNLLHRINKELHADFDLSKFRHYPIYLPASGECRSYLLSLEDQEVTLGVIDKKISFDQWEPIFMEISKKYSLSEIQALARASGFEHQNHFMDNQSNFIEVIWEVL
ncbi:MAG: L-histidine N-alpha-methyltransferase [Cyclobacteriaceae bacterium]|jgi:L-histidine N-alpha-methyltransferase